MIKYFKSVVLVFCIIQASLTQAAIVTLNGSAIKYEYDDVANATALAIFGTPTIVGNEIRFLPPNFRAESLNGAGADLMTANFVFSSVYSTNKKDILQLQIVEFGDYEITDGDSVTADLLFSVFNNSNFAEFTTDAQAFNMTGSSAGLQTWQLNSIINPANHFKSGANNVAVSIQNTLTASTNALGEAAWIQKKLTFTASTSIATGVPVPVPTPATAWLFGFAFLGLVGTKFKK